MESLISNVTNVTNKIQDKIKDATEYIQENIPYPSPSPSPSPFQDQDQSKIQSGGKRTKKNRRRKHLKGGNFRAHSPSNGLAAHASPISGIQTAKFYTVGGKRRKSKCKKHHCKKHHCNKHHCNKHHRHTSKCRR